MRLHKTGHPIADMVSDLIGELPDGDYKIAYGILRHQIFNEDAKWFEVDKGFWGAEHYGGNYRASFKGTQPRYDPNGLFEPHPFKPADYLIYPENLHTLICPPSSYACDFFGINYADWLLEALSSATNPLVRHKSDAWEVPWSNIGKVVTFNSTIGYTALLCGIPVESDPIHSTIGSWNNSVDAGDRDKLFSFCAAHQFKLGQKDKLIKIIEHYI